jgi:hypothetical protein
VLLGYKHFDLLFVSASRLGLVFIVAGIGLLISKREIHFFYLDYRNKFLKSLRESGDYFQTEIINSFSCFAGLKIMIF